MYKQMTKANKKLMNERLNKTLLTKSEILAIGKLFNSKRWSSDERKKDIGVIQDALYDVLETRSYDITKEQSDFGIDWLKSKVLTKKGKLSQAKAVDTFRESDAEIIKDFAKFEFVGFEEIDNGWSNYYTPVYRTVDTKGNYFDYFAIHWGSVDVVNRGRKVTKLEKALK